MRVATTKDAHEHLLFVRGQAALHDAPHVVVVIVVY